jgi:hypothetical protein
MEMAPASAWVHDRIGLLVGVCCLSGFVLSFSPANFLFIFKGN